MDDIRIEITSERGKGATTVAVLVGRLLRALGFTVSYEGSGGRDSMASREALRQIEGYRKQDISQPRRIQLIDRGP